MSWEWWRIPNESMIEPSGKTQAWSAVLGERPTTHPAAAQALPAELVGAAQPRAVD